MADEQERGEHPSADRNNNTTTNAITPTLIRPEEELFADDPHRSHNDEVVEEHPSEGSTTTNHISEPAARPLVVGVGAIVRPPSSSTPLETFVSLSRRYDRMEPAVMGSAAPFPDDHNHPTDGGGVQHTTREPFLNSSSSSSVILPQPPQSNRSTTTSLEDHHRHHPSLALSPSRSSSLMSSIASNSCSTNTSIVDNDDLDRDGDTNEEQDDDNDGNDDPAVMMFTGGIVSLPPAKMGALAGTITTTTCMDDKSFRSVESRPDPPSVVDGKDQNDDSVVLLLDTMVPPMDHCVGMSPTVVHNDDITDPPLVATNGRPDAVPNQDKHASPVALEPQASIFYDSNNNNEDVLSPEHFAAHALTSLSEGRLDNHSNGTAADNSSYVKPPEEPLESLPLEPEITPPPPAADEPALLRSSLVGPDHLVILPRVDEHRFYMSPPLHPRQIMTSTSDVPVSSLLNNHSNSHAFVSAGAIPQAPMSGGGMGLLQQQQQQQQQVNGLSSLGGGSRRKIRLRLQEEVKNTVGTIRQHFRTTSLLGSLKRNSSRVLRFGGSVRSMDWDQDAAAAAVLDTPGVPQTLYRTVERGTITISWYDGTSSLELQQHVRKTILRKLKLESTIVDLDDIRILDETVDPPEEIVLSPYIPDGSQFLLRFNTISPNDKLKTHTDGTTTPRSEWSGRPPLSPSAAPSPHPEKDLLSNLNANQLALLKSMKMPNEKAKYDEKKSKRRAAAKKESSSDSVEAERNPDTMMIHPLLRREEGPVNADEDLTEMGDDDDDDEEDDMMLHSVDPIETRLRQITEILLADRRKVDGNGRAQRREEKRQVIFVVANYFVLFLALIAVSAELQMRAPNWLKMMEEHLQSVQNCGGSQEALYECISRGDFAGLIASLILWLSRSVATRRFFLFGFDTPKKLWTVVYESLVTSLCWGISYLFIRRGMNPDTRPRFVQKYWKDAVYGSLAGFNAAFLKHVLKNLIPQEVVEDAIRERHLKVLGWLPSFFA